jgi:hypothetical protein
MRNERGSLAVRILSLFEGVTIALDSLRRTARAALTILGVAVGVIRRRHLRGNSRDQRERCERLRESRTDDVYAESVSDHVRGV